METRRGFVASQMQCSTLAVWTDTETAFYNAGNFFQAELPTDSVGAS